MNLCVKNVKRCGHGFRTFEHYRLRLLLHADDITWPAGLARHESEPALGAFPSQTRKTRLARADLHACSGHND